MCYSRKDHSEDYEDVNKYTQAISPRASQVALVEKNPPANAGDIRDVGSIPESGRSPEGGHGNPFQHSCLENPMERGVWQDTIHRDAKNHT